MKKKPRTAKKPDQHDQDMLPEYSFDYGKARPNRFAARIKRGSRVVVIDPDVAAPEKGTSTLNVFSKGGQGSGQ